MIEAVIFDWMGTLYSRDIGPFPDSEYTLKRLKDKNVKMCLISLGKNREKRIAEIDSSGLRQYFQHIEICEEKTAIQFLTCMNVMQTSNRSTAIADDRTVRGIQIGNSLNCPTFWIQRGEYAKEEPNELTGQPTYVIKSICELLEYF